MLTPIEELAEQIVAGTLHVQVGRTFHLDEIAEAHRCMEENKAGGKIVVRPSSAPEGDRHREDQAGASPARTAACSGEINAVRSRRSASCSVRFLSCVTSPKKTRP